MAWYPKAVQRKISVNFDKTVSQKNAVILHTTAAADTTSQYNWFNNPSARASSHFHVAFDGTVEQYIDTDYISWASLQGNSRSISIETQGSGYDKWSAAQLTSLTKLIRWICDVHGIPVRMMETSNTQEWGIGWHRIGIDGNFPTTGLLRGHNHRGGNEKWAAGKGKICPGDDRILQMPNLIESVKAAKPSGAKKSKVKAVDSVEVEFEDGTKDSVDLKDTIGDNELSSVVEIASNGTTPPSSFNDLGKNQASSSMNIYTRVNDTDFYAQETVNTVLDDDGLEIRISSDAGFSTENRGEVLSDSEIQELLSNPLDNLSKCFMVFYGEKRDKELVYLTDGVKAEIKEYSLPTIEISTSSSHSAQNIGHSGPDGLAGPSANSKTVADQSVEWGTLTGDLGSWSEGSTGDSIDTGTMWGNANKVAKWLTSHTFSKLGGPMSINQAAGVIGNWGQESRLNPAAVQPNSSQPTLSNDAVLWWGQIGGKAVGLAQWDGPRRVALVNYAKSKGKSWADIDLQLEYFAHELDGYEGNMLVAAGFTGSQSVHGYVRTFEQGFERAGLPNYAARYNFADQFLAQYSSGNSARTQDGSVANMMSLMSMSSKGTTGGDYEYDYSLPRPVSNYPRKNNFRSSRVDADNETIPFVWKDVLIGSIDVPKVVSYDLDVTHSLVDHHNYTVKYDNTSNGGWTNLRRQFFTGITDIINDGAYVNREDVFIEKVLIHGVANGGVITLQKDSGIDYIYTNGKLVNTKSGATIQTVSGRFVMALYHVPQLGKTTVDSKSLSSFLSSIDELVSPIPHNSRVQLYLEIKSPNFTAPNGVIDPIGLGDSYAISFSGSTFTTAPKIFSTLAHFTQFPPVQYISPSPWEPFADCKNYTRIANQGVLTDTTVILRPVNFSFKNPDGSWNFSAYPNGDNCRPQVVDGYFVAGEDMRTAEGFPRFDASRVVYWNNPWQVKSFKVGRHELAKLCFPCGPQDSKNLKYYNFTLPDINSDGDDLKILYGARLFGIDLPEGVTEAKFDLNYSDRKSKIRFKRVAITRNAVIEAAGGMLPERSVANAFKNDAEGHLLAPIAPSTLKIANDWWSMRDLEYGGSYIVESLENDMTGMPTDMPILYHVQAKRLPDGVEIVNGYLKNLYSGTDIMNREDGQATIVVPALPSSVKVVNDYLNSTFASCGSIGKRNLLDNLSISDYMWKVDTYKAIYTDVLRSFYSRSYMNWDGNLPLIGGGPNQGQDVSTEVTAGSTPSQAIGSMVSERSNEREKYDYSYIYIGNIKVETNPQLNADTARWMKNTYSRSAIDPRDPNLYNPVPRGNHIPYRSLEKGTSIVDKNSAFYETLSYLKDLPIADMTVGVSCGSVSQYIILNDKGDKSLLYSERASAVGNYNPCEQWKARKFFLNEIPDVDLGDMNLIDMATHTGNLYKHGIVGTDQDEQLDYLVNGYQDDNSPVLRNNPPEFQFASPCGGEHVLSNHVEQEHLEYLWHDADNFGPAGYRWSVVKHTRTSLATYKDSAINMVTTYKDLLY